MVTGVVWVVASLAVPAYAQQDEPSNVHPSGHERIGVVHFANTGSRPAQVSFQRGIALLHSFMYHDAASAFRESQRIDPSFAMAYWGEALTYIHTAWREENLAAAQRNAGYHGDAVRAFAHSLERRPNRLAALVGLERAQRAAGDTASARATAQRLRTMLHAADRGVLHDLERAR